MLIQSAAREMIQVGNVAFLDIQNLIHVCAGSAGGDKYSTVRLPSGSAGYAVTTGKTLKIRAIQVRVHAAAAGQQVYFGYGDTDVGLNSVAAPTNSVVNGGNLTALMFPLGATGAQEYAVRFDVPAGKYLYINAGGAAVISVSLYGYEV